MVYITFKPYPTDYVDGKLLVDPFAMMNDGYGDTAMFMGFCVARLVERRWVNFEPCGITGVGLATCVVGLILMWVMISSLCPVLDVALGTHWGHFVYNFFLVFYIIALFPAMIKVVMGRSHRRA